MCYQKGVQGRPGPPRGPLHTFWYGQYGNELDTRDSLRKYPNMQTEDDVVICIRRSTFGYTIAHANPVFYVVIY